MTKTATRAVCRRIANTPLQRVCHQVRFAIMGRNYHNRVHAPSGGSDREDGARADPQGVVGS
ncbi:MAG: hypothetical protein J0I44_00520, partial [Microbacterium sp.]|nr:hypothetical protein [Microbacterium sp.]